MSKWLKEPELHKPMTKKRYTKIVALVLTLGLVYVLTDYVDGPRVLARAVSPEGVEMLLIQRCNWGAELFTTSFWYRKPDKPWGWFYYDHEDSFWLSGDFSLDAENATVVFFRDGTPAVTFNWDSERYTLHRFNRTLEGAQNVAPIGTPQPY